MNVWVVSFDESEAADDPLLRVFANRVLAEHAIRQMAMGTFSAQVDAMLEEGVEFTLNLWDEELAERLEIVMRQCRVEQPNAVLAKEVL